MNGRAAGVAAAALLTVAPLQAQHQDTVPAPGPRAPQDTAARASLYVRPLASLLVPGSGQLMAHQDRAAVYLAAEVYLLSRFLQLDREATREATRFQTLAFNVARRPYMPERVDTVFEYYEQMERFAASGLYDTDPGPVFAPETDFLTYNGSVWLLARRTFWSDPNVPPDPTSQAYINALNFYWNNAVTSGFQWSWRNHSLEHEEYRQSVRRSDDTYRKAQDQVGLLLANHVLSAVDALISARLAAAAGRAVEMHSLVGLGGRTGVWFTVPF
ncbi:MAG TPA: hypothetical protein VJ755_00925 [Gemmatimonadales bacterium]|nr:hypothetical protein [Gemmatimonadales bacterium]